MAVNPHQSWFDVDGDNTLALDWDLNENSHVWEIGGFKGRWAQQIWDKFHCYIHIFEPQEWAVQKLRERFNGIEKVFIHPYGLWTKHGNLPIGDYFTDGASVLKTKEPVVSGSLFEDVRKVVSLAPLPIDVALMNVEGAEYTLVPILVHDNLIQKFKNFWCQFHPDNENDTRHLEIFNGMERTHNMLWDYYPTAVAWRKR